MPTPESCIPGSAVSLPDIEHCGRLFAMMCEIQPPFLIKSAAGPTPPENQRYVSVV